MKLSTATGGFPPNCGGEAEVYRLIADAGYSYVNYDFPNFSHEAPFCMDYVQDDWQKAAKQHLERMKQAGLTPVQAHGPFAYPLKPEAEDPFLQACIRSILSCRKMQIPQVVLHPLAEKGMSYDAFLNQNVQFFRQLIPAMEETGVYVLIENIGQYTDPHFVRTGAELRRLIEEVDHPLFGACWDIGHANHIMNDQSESLKMLAPLLKGLHVHDNLGDMKPGAGTYFNDMHTLPLFGIIHFDIVIRTLKEIGYKGFFNFETARPKDRSFEKGDQLQHILPEVKKQVLCLEHTIGRLMLQAYDCYEES